MKIKADSSAILLNSMSSVTQVIVQGLTYFFLYKYLFNQLGGESLGFWSLVIATTSAANVANLGIAGSIVQYIAENRALGKEREVLTSISTSLLLMIVFMGFISLIFKFLTIYLITDIIPPHFLSASQRLIDISCICLFVNAITAIYSSVLEGMQKLYVRNIILIVANILFLAAILILVPKYKLLGTVYAQLFQALLSLILSFFCVIFLLKPKNISAFFSRFDKAVAKRLLKTGYKFQIISITLLLFDPLTKYLLTIAGGLNAVTFYEMANRLVVQIRNIIVLGGQSLITIVAKFNTLGIELGTVYKKSFKLVFCLAIVVSFSLILSSGLVSLIWIGYQEEIFVRFVVILAIGWFFNIISTPFYFTNIGLNKLNGNVISHVVIFICTATFGLFGWMINDGNWIVYGVSFSLFFASVYLMKISSKTISMNIFSLFGGWDKIFGILLVLLALFVLLFITVFMKFSIGYSVVFSVFIPLLVFFIYWRKDEDFKEALFKLLRPNN